MNFKLKIFLDCFIPSRARTSSKPQVRKIVTKLLFNVRGADVKSGWDPLYEVPRNSFFEKKTKKLVSFVKSQFINKF